MPALLVLLQVPHVDPGWRAEGAELVEPDADAPIPLGAPVPAHAYALFPSLSRRHSVSSVTVSFVARHQGSGRTLPSVLGGKIRIKGAIVLFSF